MRLTIEQPALQAVLSRTTGVVEKRNTIPILGNVLLYAVEGTLKVTATDLDIEVFSFATAEVEVGGGCTVRADLLAGIAGKLAKGKAVTLSLSNGILTVTSGKSEFQLATLDAQDFPTMARVEYSATFAAPGHDLARLFNLAAFAMSDEETRYYLQGVYLHPVDGFARGVATDGHRLAKIDSEIEAEFPGVIVPRKTVAEIRKLATDSDVTVSVSDHAIRFDFGETVLTSKTIDGTFPNYEAVIPQNNTKIARFDAGEMKDASSRVSLVATERTKSVKIDIADDEVTLTVNGGDGDKGVETIGAEYSGEPIKVAVNSKYLAEVLQHCPGDAVEFKINAPMTPIIIQPSGDDKALYVLMPLRY